MTISVTHAFQSGKADGSDATLVQPSNWNAEHTITMATSRLLGRLTAGTGAVEELTATQLWTLLGIVTGTAMVFAQTAAPTGWTKSATHDDKALRVVTGTASSGGSSPFSTVFGKTATDSHTLTTTEIPSHSHSAGTLSAASDGAHTHSYTRPTNDHNTSISGGTQTSDSGTSATTGSSGAHTHSITGSTATAGSGGGHTHPMDIRVQYVDVIIATKD